jgi:GntR family transcriptional regulator
VQRAEDRIGLGEVPDWAPAAFGPRPGAAVPLIERQSRAQDGRVAEVSRSWFDWEKARYVARLK